MALKAKEHIYFDRVVRKEKLHTLLALAYSYYYFEDKEKIRESLEYFLNIFRQPPGNSSEGSGTYSGTPKQFSSQYTPALEFGLLKSGKENELTDLGIMLVEGKISPNQFISNVMLNFFQYINGKSINLIYEIFKYMKANGKDRIEKKDLYSVFNENESNRDSINILHDILSATLFFEEDNDENLTINNIFNLEELINECNLEMYSDDFNVESYLETTNQEQYSEFITQKTFIVDKMYHSGEIKGKDSKIDLSKEKNQKSLNRIIYGAPGTGKSYLLNKEASERFKKLLIEKTVEETEETDEDRRSWVVGAKWGADDQTKRFIEEGIWENGYSDKYLEKVKEVQEGDFIAIKSSFTRKKTDGKFISVLRTKAIGVVKKNHNDGIKLDVEWINTEERDYDGISYRLTIHEVAEKFLHIFNPISQLNKVVYTEKKEVNTIERVTFYDGYTYGQFVGSYKPIPKNNSITYEYVAGPLMRQLVKAYKNPNDNFCLIIEEINRARADKVFGNIFQLLDRDIDGKSQYPVSLSEEQILYLQKVLGEDDQEILEILLTDGLYIPANLYIWATMNSADQGVYPLDTAFKRRWSFEHIGLNENESKLTGLKVRLEKDLEVEWNDFRKEINESLLSIKVSEDRLLSPFFVKKEEFIDGILDDKVFVDKVLVYLFDDVLRHKKKEVLFKGEINSFSKLKEELSSGGKIFKDEFYEKFYSETKLKSYSSSESEVEGVAAPNEPYNDGVE